MIIILGLQKKNIYIYTCIPIYKDTEIYIYILIMQKFESRYLLNYSTGWKQCINLESRWTEIGSWSCTRAFKVGKVFQFSWFVFLIDLTMFPLPLGTACGFKRTGHHLIMEGVNMTIWTNHFKTSGLGVEISSLSFPDHLIYRLRIFFSGVPSRALCDTCSPVLKCS